MADDQPAPIPNRAETLKILRLMGEYEPIIMLAGDEDGYGTRWTLLGGEIHPAIALYLVREGFLEESGKTELGARRLSLTRLGQEFRDKGLAWWRGLSLWQRLKVIVFG